MDITLDFDIYHWKLGERMLFEKVAGMTCERAVALFAKAADDDDAALDVPAVVQAAFVWIAVRRRKPGTTFEEVADSYDGADFMNAIPEPPEEAPLANRAQRRSTGKSSARSASSSSTPRSKSET